LIPERSDDADGWKKSSRSGKTEACVEVKIDDKSIHVRHSKDPGGPALTFSRAEWLAFLDGVHHGEFELSDASP
jgi:Domain of unknown function (DUF397)